MGSLRAAPPPAVVATAATTSALLFFLGTGPHPIPALAWFAAAPVLSLALALPRARDAFAWSALAFALGAANHVARHDSLRSLPAVALALFGPALVFGACVLLAQAVTTQV